MKRLLSMLLSVVMLVVSLNMVFATSESTEKDCRVTKISREEYLQGIAGIEGIFSAQEEANKPVANVGAYDEAVRYAIVEKEVDVITNGKGYTQSVIMGVYISYICDRWSGDAVALENVTAPYVYVQSDGLKEACFDCGEYSITENSYASYTVVVLGRALCLTDGRTVSEGYDIINATQEGSDTRYTTGVLTLKPTFTLNMLNR